MITEKDQAAIEVGRFEIANGRFYHQDDSIGPFSEHYSHTPPPPGSQYFDDNDDTGLGQSSPVTRKPVGSGSSAPRSSSKISDLISKATNRSSANLDNTAGELAAPSSRERGKLKKRSSSRLSVVGE